MLSNSVLLSFSRVLCFIPSYSQISHKFFPNLIKTSPLGCKSLRHKAVSLFIPFPFAIWMKLEKRCLRFRKDTRWSFFKTFCFLCRIWNKLFIKILLFYVRLHSLEGYREIKNFCNQYSFFIGGICPVPEQTIPVQ